MSTLDSLARIAKKYNYCEEYHGYLLLLLWLDSSSDTSVFILSVSSAVFSFAMPSLYKTLQHNSVRYKFLYTYPIYFVNI